MAVFKSKFPSLTISMYLVSNQGALHNRVATFAQSPSMEIYSLG
jgi:hypothetical protein